RLLASSLHSDRAPRRRPSSPTRRSSDLQPALQVHVLPPQREAAGAVTRMNAARAEQQRAVTADRTAPTQHVEVGAIRGDGTLLLDRKSTRLNSSHDQISYAVFCLKKKTS